MQLVAVVLLVVVLLAVVLLELEVLVDVEHSSSSWSSSVEQVLVEVDETLDVVLGVVLLVLLFVVLVLPDWQTCPGGPPCPLPLPGLVPDASMEWTQLLTPDP